MNVALTLAQIAGGALSGSVALVADALHNLNDAMALVIVVVARRIGRRRADRMRTFGYRRARTVGALINLVALGVVALVLAYESILRLFDPPRRGLLDEERCALEAHLVVERDAVPRLDELMREAHRRLRDEFGVHHATLEPEFPEVAAAGGHDTSLIVDGARPTR